MSWTSEAHTQWHSIHGRYAVCPLDCGAGEWLSELWDEEFRAIDEGEPTFKCGHCGGRHVSAFAARVCAGLVA